MRQGFGGVAVVVASMSGAQELVNLFSSYFLPVALKRGNEREEW